MNTPTYRFSKNKRRSKYIVGLIDQIGNAIYYKKNKLIDINLIDSVCFVQLGHIGDFILMLPALNALKNKCRIEIHVAINPINQEIAKRLPFIDKVYIVYHPSFARDNSFKKSIFQSFREIRSDLIFDVRGDIRIIPFLKLLASYRYLVGFDSGGFGFILDKVLTYPFEQHITKTYESILPLFNLENLNPINLWDPNLIPTQNILINTDNYICVNIGVGGSSKEWEWDKYVSLIKMLSTVNNVIVIGRESETKINFFKEKLAEQPKVKVLINETNMFESIYIIKKADYFVGLDSGFTHIASILGKKTFAIYSDTTKYNVWKPIQIYANQVSYIKKDVDCGNCGKIVCSNNICMKLISIDEVFKKIIIHYNN